MQPTYKLLADVEQVNLFEQTSDVQARQTMVMNRALADAWSAGFDWMLQLDIDELLYLPREVEREDARAFFASVRMHARVQAVSSAPVHGMLIHRHAHALCVLTA